MRINTKFSVAVHALILIAIEPDLCSSAWIAGSVNTNPVVIRRILGLLQKANLIIGSQGKTGYNLLKSPGDLTLLDVYKAVSSTEADQLFAIHEDTNIECPVGASIQFLLDGVMGDAQTAMETILSTVTISQLIKKIPQATV